MAARRHYIVRDVDLERTSALVERGHKQRHVFPHRVVRAPKTGPDAFKLGQLMCGPAALSEMWELLLYVLPPVLGEFPADVFFDDDIAWHRQQLGLPGLVATVNLVEKPPDLYLTALHSDLVQRIGRRRDLKTRIENRLKGWSRMQLNAALGFAMDRGLDRVNVPTSGFAMEHTDRARDVKAPLFERVYDHSVGPPFTAVRKGSWWVLEVAANASTVVPAAPRQLVLDDEPEICVCHDIERGWGHRLEDPAFAAAAEGAAAGYLDRMLDIEAAAGIRATYNVVGAILPEVAPAVAAGGHTVGFHSFDHDLTRRDQLGRCRAVDYRLKGYRPPKSRINVELGEERLAFHNFEWLASSRASLGFNEPRRGDRVAYVPILFDDFALHRGDDYEDWQAKALQTVSVHSTATFSLHDCYAGAWLPRYAELLRILSDLGHLRTVDEVAADLYLTAAI